MGESEVERIATALEALEKRMAALRRSTSVDRDVPQGLLQRAKRIYRARRERDRLFGKADLFGEPAWDMLLDLFIAAEEGKQISVSSLCIASSVPQTTALRWIAILEAEALIMRTPDPIDARRVFLSLSKSGHDILKQHLAHLGG
jgi:DNA-binding MarR family transcriptional regulator